MTVPRCAAVLAALLLGAGNGRAAEPAPTACEGMTAPRRLTIGKVELPPSYTAARIGGIVVDEAVIGVDARISAIRLVRTRWEGLGPFAQKSVEDSRFEAALIEGNPVATRVQIATPLGNLQKTRAEPEYDMVWAHVPGGQPREARWQLAQSVESLTVTAHLGNTPGAGGDVVAVAPDGKERILVRIPESDHPVDARETVSTGDFFSPPGDYRLELRSGGKALAWTTLTIADDYTRAIVNACQPL